MGFNLLDLILPWKHLEDKSKKTKKSEVGTTGYIGETTKKDSNKSFISGIGAIGQKYTDPLAWIFGQKYLDLLNETIPEKTNKFLQPVTHLARKTDPLYYLTPKDSGYNEAGDWTENHSADVIAALIAAYFGGAAALGGAGGGASSGSGAAAGGASGGASSGFSAYGPLAGGYSFPEGSSLGSAGSSGFSAYGPYASGYQFPAGSPYAGAKGAAPFNGFNDFSQNLPQSQTQKEQEQRRRDLMPMNLIDFGIGVTPPDLGLLNKYPRNYWT